MDASETLPSLHVESSGDAEPVHPVSTGWTARFSLVWFGFWMAQLLPIQLLLPDTLDRVDPVHKVRDFGVLNGVAAMVALLTLPLCGALCDRTRTRFGRRRTWMACGLVVVALGLGLTGLQSTPVGVTLAWLLVVAGVSAATAGLTAAIADQVPEQQRGTVSGAIYAPQALGVVAGVAALSAVTLTDATAYLLLAAVLVLCAIPFVLRYRDSSAPIGRPVSALSALTAIRFNPRSNPDFTWALAGRTLVNLGNGFGTCYLLYFLTDDVHVADPATALLILTAIYLVGMVLTTILGGLLSDRLARRRVFVAVAAVLQSIAGLLLAAFPTLGAAMVGAAVLGAGYGAYMSVDQALVTQVLPDAASRAKDLGIMNMGSIVPQGLSPLIASVIILASGYPALYLATGVATALGAVLVYRVRCVR
jgi:MFS family permease